MFTSSFGFESTAEEVTSDLDLSGTTWLVTGCNSGLGRETTRVLSLRGGHVIGTARTLEKAQQAMAEDGVSGTPIACELTDLASVRAAVQQIVDLGVPLTGIIANAGIMALPDRKQVNGIEMQMFTNHVGHFALVNGIVDTLAPNGRVVILSSEAHRMAPPEGVLFDDLSGEAHYHPWASYGQSKLANILYAKALAKRFTASGSARTANALHPGVILTNLGRHLPNAAKSFARLRQKTIPQGAATQVFLATHPDLGGITGRYFSDCNEMEPTKAAQDADMAEKLWQVTEALIGA